MKLIRVERNAFAASFTSSAEGTSVRTTVPSRPGVQGDDALGVGGVEAADDDPVGPHEVRDGGALREELRVRDVADVREAARVEARAHVLAGADGNRALHHDDRAARHVRRQLVDDREHGGEVGVARVRRRRADGDVEELGAVDGLADVERERDPVAVAREHLVEAGLVDRHLAGPQALDPLRNDVPQDDLVPELGEAGPGDETDVAGAEDADAGHGG